MRRLAPSEAIRNEIQNALNQGLPEGEDMMSWLVTKSVQRLLQEILEQEITDHLGRGRYERSGEGQGYRNGYEDRQVKTSDIE